MLKLRVLLFFIGVAAVILGTESYSYSYPGPLADASYGYTGGYVSGAAYPAGYGQPVYGGAYGGYGGYGSTAYSDSCGDATVLEVLDSIFCQHGPKRRYSSTIYPTIEVVIDQIEYLLDFCFLQTVFDYLESAKLTLETLQDATYTIFEDSSMLHGYYEGGVDSQSQGTSGTSGTAGTSGAGTSGSRTATQQKMTEFQSKLSGHASNAQTFKTNRNLQMNSKTKTKQQSASSSVKGGAVKQRSGDVLDVAVLTIQKETTVEREARAIPERDEALIKKLQKRMSSLKREARSSSRKTRGADYSDYTCSYISTAYCHTDKYDELLYNMLERVWTVLDFLDLALYETWLFMLELSCDTDDDRYALEEAAITFGAILQEFYTILEVAIDLEKMYELIELEYGDESSGYYRAASGSSSQPQPSQPMNMVPMQVQAPMMKRPMTMTVPMTVNRTPASQGYPFVQYQPQPQAPVSYSSYSSYPMAQQQYRVSRATPQTSVRGATQNLGSTSGQGTTLLVLG